jgi:hypothetical protein
MVPNHINIKVDTCPTTGQQSFQLSPADLESLGYDVSQVTGGKMPKIYTSTTINLPVDLEEVPYLLTVDQEPEGEGDSRFSGATCSIKDDENTIQNGRIRTLRCRLNRIGGDGQTQGLDLGQ